jgi:hypothetical protein
MQLGGIEEHTAFLVADEGVVVPAVPQAVDNVGELDGALVAIAVAEMRLARVVQRPSAPSSAK